MRVAILTLGVIINPLEVLSTVSPSARYTVQEITSELAHNTIKQTVTITKLQRSGIKKLVWERSKDASPLRNQTLIKLN
jgi:hypothetical protein